MDKYLEVAGVGTEATIILLRIDFWPGSTLHVIAAIDVRGLECLLDCQTR